MGKDKRILNALMNNQLVVPVENKQKGEDCRINDMPSYYDEIFERPKGYVRYSVI